MAWVSKIDGLLIPAVTISDTPLRHQTKRARQQSGVVAPRSACPLYPLRLLRHPGLDIITLPSPHSVPMVVYPPSPPVFYHFFGADAPTMLSGVTPEPPWLFGLRPIFSSLCVGRMAPFFTRCPPPPGGVFYGASPLCPPPSIPHGIAKKKATCWVALFIRPTVVSPSGARRGRASLLAACATSFVPGR